MSVIVSVNNSLDVALRNLGHTVYTVDLPHTGTYSAKSIFKQFLPQNIEVDVFIHKEILAKKIFFNDIHELSCQTAFWGIDTHLHYAWQIYYAKLFDVFFTPHKAFLEYLPKDWQHPQVIRLPQHGIERPFIAHKDRQHSINFVGRTSGTRPQREQLCHILLQEYDVQHREDLSFSQMMDLYSQTCILPNESIANEVNFRLMEGASCGVGIISNNVGEDQSTLFLPDEEILIYKNFLDFHNHMDYFLSNPTACETMGRKAWERVQKEHLPQHRAMQMCNALFDNYTEGMREQKYAQDIAYFTFFLVCFYNFQQEEHVLPFREYSYELKSLELVQNIFLIFKENPTQIQEEACKNKVYALLRLADTCLFQSSDPLEYKKILATACAGAALQYGDSAKANFYLRIHQKLCKRPLLDPNHCPVETAMSWIVALVKEQKQCFVGSVYQSGCCRTAFDFVSLIRERSPFDMRWAAAITLLDQVWKHYPGCEHESMFA